MVPPFLTRFYATLDCIEPKKTGLIPLFGVPFVSHVSHSCPKKKGVVSFKINAVPQDSQFLSQHFLKREWALILKGNFDCE